MITVVAVATMLVAIAPESRRICAYDIELIQGTRHTISVWPADLRAILERIKLFEEMLQSFVHFGRTIVRDA